MRRRGWRGEGPDTENEDVTVAQKINRERVVVLGWGRAILLQLAHPMVAAGVAAHSHFAAGPLSRLHRLNATVGAMLDFTFGDEDRVARAAARINAIHDRVNGRLAAAAGGCPVGARYSATDPALLLWVHATLLDSVPFAYEQFVGHLDEREKDAYCLESAATGRLLRIPEPMLPRTAVELREYIARMLGSGQLEVTPVARAVARDLLYSPLLDPTRPGAWLNRVTSLGLLPARIREGYGFPWTARHQRLFRILRATLPRVVRLTPGFLRFWPEARRLT